MITNTVSANKKFLKFLISGLWNTVLTILLTKFAMHTFPIANPKVIFSILSFLIILQSHFLMRRLVWESESPYFFELVKFFIGYIPAYIINLLSIQVFVIQQGYDLLIILILNSAVIVSALFIYQSKFTFKER